MMHQQLKLRLLRRHRLIFTELFPIFLLLCGNRSFDGLENVVALFQQHRLTLLCEGPLLSVPCIVSQLPSYGVP